MAVYRRKMDHVGEFLVDQCEQGETFTIGAAELYHAYSAWCAETATTPLTRSALNDRLTEHGLERKRSNKGFIWHGLCLKETIIEERTLGDDEAAA